MSRAAALARHDADWQLRQHAIAETLMPFGKLAGTAQGCCGRAVVPSCCAFQPRSLHEQVLLYQCPLGSWNTDCELQHAAPLTPVIPAVHLGGARLSPTQCVLCRRSGHGHPTRPQSVVRLYQCSPDRGALLGEPSCALQCSGSSISMLSACADAPALALFVLEGLDCFSPCGYLN